MRPTLLVLDKVCDFLWHCGKLTVLTKVNDSQIHLQQEALALFCQEKRDCLMSKATEKVLQVCKTYDTPTDKRVGRRKKLAGVGGLNSVLEETQGVLKVRGLGGTILALLRALATHAPPLLVFSRTRQRLPLCRINNSNIVSELVFSLSNILVLYNDRIIHKASHLGDVTFGEQLKIWLTVLEYSEVFIEISSRKLWGERSRWVIVVCLQIFK
ncbi:unnamed protein product [Timema podura]|uniref:Peroxisomal membrane protein PEX16 n=1 Tax=Timema podura TaxID=61482 RepID=A0ABN7NS18_TIMPD|nr:unnamed protein product [Timema podura]